MILGLVTSALQPQILLGKFISNLGQTLIFVFDSFIAMDLVLVVGLVNNPNTTHDNKLARAIALYAC